jgi:opacity protein-like surface antigen
MGSLNLFWDAPIAGYLKPYLGGGFGFAMDSGSSANFSNANGFSVTQYAAQSTQPIVLGEVGLTVALTSRWSIVPAYRYVHYFNSGSTVSEEANIFKLGVRFSF